MLDFGLWTLNSGFRISDSNSKCPASDVQYQTSFKKMQIYTPKIFDFASNIKKLSAESRKQKAII